MNIGDGIEVVTAAGAELGEGPVWDARSGRVVWVELYITSARQGLSARQRRAEPLAGALFRARPGVRGIAPAVVVGV